MIERYTLPQMGEVWSQENKFRKWLEVEVTVCEVLAHLGYIPKEAAKEIREKARFQPERIELIESEVHHDIIAFLTNLSQNIGEQARYVHLGLTSSDVLDTSFALLLREAGRIIVDDLERLLLILRKRALEFKSTPMLGRTHGIWAEPITFGLKLAVWHQETLRNLARMRRAIEGVSVGKLSGAVGTYAHLDPQVEEEVCERLGLKPAGITTQIIQRDRYAEYLTTLAIISSSLEKFATEVRNLQRTEIREVEEPFLAEQKGSSAMPHKRNPILCERICGLSRVVRANCLAALENIPLWGERDISHSSTERVIFPDSTILVDYILNKSFHILENLVVHPQRMMENLKGTKGLVFSQKLMLELVKKGMGRDEAYRVIQDLAKKVWEGKGELKVFALEEGTVSKTLGKDLVEGCFQLEPYLKKIDGIFQRAGLVGDEDV